MTARQITRADILPMEEYGRIRQARRQEITALKQHRRVAVGPDITFYFESFATMLHQVHEMLIIEKGARPRSRTSFAPTIP